MDIKIYPRKLCCCLYYLPVLLLLGILEVQAADVVIQIPEDRVREQDGTYRLHYSPPQGVPPPNTTFTPIQVANGIELSRALPGTKYDFQLYYTNATINDYPTWTASITTVPPPPSNLTIDVIRGDMVKVSWEPPDVGGYSAFKLKVIPLSEELQNSVRNVVISEGQLPFNLRELIPGASYELQLYTVYENKESAAYISSNFTTRPNAPGRFIVWYRNETTMLVLWQPPYPPGIYSHYRVSIDPKDAVNSVLTVEKDGDPPGPAQAPFHGLVPGRAYNITVETVSGTSISDPTTAQYRTIPLSPRNVTFDPRRITSDSFIVAWESPKNHGEFDKYSLSIGADKGAPLLKGADEPREALFSQNLEPGHFYTVLVKTISGNVASWPTTGNVTTRPLRVTDLLVEEQALTGVLVSWTPQLASKQDSYKIVYQEQGSYNGDSRTSVVEEEFAIAELYPGRNYTVLVSAVSNGIESAETAKWILTKPASPIIEELQPIPRGLNISWKSDVTSRQEKYAVIYTRNDTAESVTRQISTSNVLLDDLFPGAGYHIKVYAISHGKWSEPHIYTQAVYPNPVRNLTIIETSNTSVSLGWQPPIESLFSHYVVRYRTQEKKTWQELPPVNRSHASVAPLMPGERYVIQVRSVSNGVESYTPMEVTQTVPPNPVRDITPILDSSNITFEWPRPEGRMDNYTFTWWNQNTPEIKSTKHVPGSQTTEGIHRKLSVLVGDLMPGEIYTFEVYTTSHGISSEKKNFTTRTKPVIRSEIYPITTLDDTTSLTVRYIQTQKKEATFDTYRFMLSDPKIPVTEKLANDTEKKIVFSGLVPGRLYNITVWTVSGGVTSPPLVRQDRLYPDPVTNIKTNRIEDTLIGLEWTRPVGDYKQFEVKYLDAEGRFVANTTIYDNIVISGLRPHRNYTFTVETQSEDIGTFRQSKPISATFTTLESTPGEVVKFEASKVKPNSVEFDWALPPDEQNGVLVEFVIKYKPQGALSFSERRFGPESVSGTIGNLIPGKTYEFEIQAKTQVGAGQIKRIKKTMPVWAPPDPDKHIIPTEVSRTSRTIHIRYRQNYFSDLNGPIIGYTVIVAEENSRLEEDLGRDLPGWIDVQSSSVWPPYQARDLYYPFNDTSVEDFKIGTDKDCSSKRNYCNGPLNPGTTYRVKIRAFTTPDMYADTYYSNPIITDSESSNVGVAVAIPIILLILIIVVVVIMRRRRVCLMGPKRATDHARKDDVHSLSDSIIETSRPVKLKDFAEHYRFMSADSDFHFSEEYEALKHVGRDLPCIAADLPVNRPKNRFTNILPYDHSRFKLLSTDDEDGTDYVNANYVPGYNSPREFIVTQGPLPSTRDDFWRMCWESNSRSIVMLTRCIEKGREKCDHYWPYDTQPVYYGDIQVTILNESHFPDWNVSEFRVCKGEVCRVMRHYHFTTWPDFGVPDPPQTLVRFVRNFRAALGNDLKPIVIHCSAGVGRSGTFIALDRILQSIRKCDYVDIFGIVYEMRRERVWMVQTEQQYICIHQCLMAVLEGREDEHPIKQIHDNQGFEDDEGIAESGQEVYSLQTLAAYSEIEIKG